MLLFEFGLYVLSDDKDVVLLVVDVVAATCFALTDDLALEGEEVVGAADIDAIDRIV